MAKAITVLENALVSRNNWNSLDSLLNYVLARCDDVDKQELEENTIFVKEDIKKKAFNDEKRR